jgi:hypothetical protein
VFRREVGGRTNIDDRRARHALPNSAGSSSCSSCGAGAAGGPSRLIVFIIAKYFGGSGWPASTLSTNCSSSSIWSAQFTSRSYPSVVDGIAPSDFPHAEPAPCPGQICK